MVSVVEILHQSQQWAAFQSFPRGNFRRVFKSEVPCPSDVNMVGRTRLRQEIAALFLALWIIACTGCTAKHSNFVEVPSDRAALLDGINSYQTQRQFQTALSHRSLRADVESSRINFVQFTVAGYQHLGCDGSIVATFVFDRLMAVKFYPSDDTSYRTALAKAGFSTLVSHGFERREKHTTIESGRDMQGVWYLWTDERLDAAWNEWTEHHAG